MNENFNFESTGFVCYSASGVTDGTTSTPQQIGSLTKAYAINGVSASVWAEPEKIISVKNEHHIWDHLTRMILITQRQTGTGTWTGKLQYTRTGGSAIDLITGIDFPPAAVLAPAITAINNPLGAIFGVDGTPALTDEVSFSFTMTAIGQAVAANLTALMLLVPGFVAAESNKGAVLSAPQFLTIR